MDRSHNDRRRAPAKRGKRRLASHGPAISGLRHGRGTPFISPGAGAPTALGPVPPFDSPVSSSPTNAIFRYPASREEVHHAHQFAVSNGAVSAQTDALLATMAGVLIEDSLQHFAVRSIVADLERQVALDGKEHGLARSRLRLSIGHGQFDRHVDGGERCRHHEYDEQHQDHVDEWGDVDIRDFGDIAVLRIFEGDRHKLLLGGTERCAKKDAFRRRREDIGVLCLTLPPFEIA